MSELRKAAQALVNQWESNTAYPFGLLVDALRAALAQPEPEPVLWEIWPRMGGSPYYSRKKPADTDYVEFTPLYTAPPPVAEPHKRKPLTKEQIIEAIKHISHNEMSAFSIAKAIEEAHGIE